MNYTYKFYPESSFGGFTQVDGTIVFYSRVNALIKPEDVVVDIGCGSGVYSNDPIKFRKELRILKGKCSLLVGIDVDNVASENPYIDQFRLIQEKRWPIEDNFADLCLVDNVLEHIEEPEIFFYECSRILKPEGLICIRTPNVYSYFGLLSRLIPNRTHLKILNQVKDEVHERNVFPTYYRCNSIGKIRYLLKKFNFNCSVTGYEAEPTYLSFSKILYYLGYLHQKIAPNNLKIVIHAFGKKITDCPINSSGLS